MAPDCGSNITGLVSNTVQGFFITNIITFTFLLLCLVPLWVQLVDKLCKLHDSKFFIGIFMMIHHVWGLIIGLYQVAHLCRHLYAPVQKSIRNNPVSQVTPLLGTTPSENCQLQHKNTPDDILDILGTCIYQGYVERPIQTLDCIVVNQPKRFLPLAEEAKCLTEEIRIEKFNEQWSGIPHKQLLNQSFTDQLNSIQILEQLAPPATH